MKYEVITAITPDERIVGWACWASVSNYSPPLPSDNNAQKEEQSLTSLQRLEAVTNLSMAEWQNKLMPKGSFCMILVAINVHPSFQGQGIGTALIKYGTDICDKNGKGWFSWVASSDKGYKAFEKMAYREVGRLAVNLDEYSFVSPELGRARNKETENGTGKWGDYIF